MSRERRTLFLAAAVLVAAGLVIGSQALPASGDTVASPFRHWLWERRSLDLIVHIALILAGALGIAALLPRGQEEELEE
ncbi:MAG: hypothetical protein GX620_04930 [Chloroflexi bacterium]|nr:hypothetical protein [Chloroflexota bacterium]